MEERVAAPVGGIDAPPQVVPVADLVHRLVADDLFEKRSRRGPVDAAQHQKAAIEPRAEQMQKIAIDDGERRVLVHKLEQVGAHRDQRGGAARRAIESPEQFVAARLGGVVDFAQPSFVAVRRRSRRSPGAPARDRGRNRRRARGRMRRGRRDRARGIARGSRRRARSRTPRPAPRPAPGSLDELLGAPVRVLRPGLDLEHGAAALGDRGQEIVEKGVAHDFPSAFP